MIFQTAKYGWTALLARQSAGGRLEPYERVEDQSFAIKVERERGGLLGHDGFPQLSERGKPRFPDQTMGELHLRFGRLACCLSTDQPRQEVEQQLKIELEALLVGGSAQLVAQRVQRLPIDLGQVADGFEDSLIESDAAARRQRNGAADAA